MCDSFYETGGARAFGFGSKVEPELVLRCASNTLEGELGMKRQKLGIAALALVGLAAGLSGCDDGASSSKDTSPKYSAKQAADFRALCTSKGGKTAETSCKGTSTCAGLFLSGETGMQSASDCKGHNSCSGIQCYDTLAAK